MGKLIVDGNSVYEIDEECLKNRPVPEECKVYDALRKMEKKNQNHERSCGRSSSIFQQTAPKYLWENRSRSRQRY